MVGTVEGELVEALPLMRTYVAQRQILPDIASTISSSVGLGVFARSAAACMICPDWQ